MTDDRSPPRTDLPTGQRSSGGPRPGGRPVNQGMEPPPSAPRPAATVSDSLGAPMPGPVGSAGRLPTGGEAGAVDDVGRPRSASIGGSTEDRNSSSQRGSLQRHSTVALGGLGLVAGGLIVGAVAIMLLIGGETRRTVVTTPPGASTGSGAGTTTNTRTGTFDDTTNTTPIAPGTGQPSNR